MMTIVDRDEQDQPASSEQKAWRTPYVTRFATAGAEAGDSGGGVDGESTKS